MSDPSVLIVEDEHQVRQMLSYMLRQYGWRVTVADSGEAAVLRLATEPCDVVLCDLDLGPGLSGLGVLRQRPAIARAIPIVILTAHGSVGRCRDLLLAGAADFLEKPIAPAQLVAALSRVCRLAAPLRAEEGEPAAPKPPAVRADEHVRRALKRIDERHADPDFSIAELAMWLQMTPEHLARLFRNRVSRTPTDVIHEVRIREARRMLVDAKLSVYEVAIECGYRTTTDLDVWFRRVCGLTPSEWRASALFRESPISDGHYRNQNLTSESD